jgi:hypothetical protein
VIVITAEGDLIFNLFLTKKPVHSVFHHAVLETIFQKIDQVLPTLKKNLAIRNHFYAEKGFELCNEFETLS